MVAMGYLAKIGLVKDWSRMTKLIIKISDLFSYFGTDKGGMTISIEGDDRTGKHLRVGWSLTADNGVGPYVPIISAIVVARKILAGEIQQRGATPCLSLYTLEEFVSHAEKLDIHCSEQFNG